MKEMLIQWKWINANSGYWLSTTSSKTKKFFLTTNVVHAQFEHATLEKAIANAVAVLKNTEQLNITIDSEGL